MFPGAEGYGTLTPAGRGGVVLEVTSLEDSGPGSLREAVLDPRPRTIVFRVGGTIVLRDFLYINEPFVTIAGQSAPGDGIQLRDFGLVIVTHDVLVRHLRIRPGNLGAVPPDQNDAIALIGPHFDGDSGRFIEGASNVVLDHVSTSWSEDEVIQTWSRAHDITISWSVVSEALNRSRHPKVTHSAGILIGDGSQRVTVHHCLLAHNDFRNPLVDHGGRHDFIGNVVYNWGVLSAEVVDYASDTFLNIMSNFYKPGRDSVLGPRPVVAWLNDGQSNPRLYVEGNIGPYRTDPLTDEWDFVGSGYDETRAPESFRSPDPFAGPPVTRSTAAETYTRVLAEAGATAPRRDSVDARVVEDVRNGTGSIIDSPAQVGGHPELRPGSAPADADHDGMPDDWEGQHGLNPSDASDSLCDRNADGYTNLEEYLNGLAQSSSTQRALPEELTQPVERNRLEIRNHG